MHPGMYIYVGHLSLYTEVWNAQSLKYGMAMSLQLIHMGCVQIKSSGLMCMFLFFCFYVMQ